MFAVGADLNEVQYWADRYADHFAGYAEDWQPDGNELERACENCGRVFIGDHDGTRFCSQDCHYRSRGVASRGKLLPMYPIFKADYDSGLSILSIANKHGVSETGVRKTLCYFGYEPRSNTAKAREKSNAGPGCRGGDSPRTEAAKKRGYWTLPQG